MVIYLVVTKCIVYSRVVGYITPVEQWNDGKQSEFEDRTEFDSVTSDMFS